jgi:hypothetical protein
VVEEHPTERGGGGNVIQKQCAGEASIQHADAARDGDGVGEIADEVRQEKWPDGNVVAECVNRQPQDGDVAEQVREGADGEAPAGSPDGSECRGARPCGGSDDARPQ